MIYFTTFAVKGLNVQRKTKLVSKNKHETIESLRFVNDADFSRNTDYDWQYISMVKLNRIRIVLAERDLNNKWLADKLGKDQATVSKWVTNTTQPSLQVLLDIAAALEVPVQELVRQEEYNQEKEV